MFKEEEEEEEAVRWQPESQSAWEIISNSLCVAFSHIRDIIVKIACVILAV